MAQEVQKLEGKKVSNPYEMATTAAKVDGPGTALAQGEAQRAMIEVMTSFEVAKRFPRDPAQAMGKILAECARPTLAEVAVYSYAKGGTEISGPSIRLMEAVARSWSNIQFGFKVLERKNGNSTVQAVARDLETNTMIERVFNVKHWRDTKKGGYLITDERDIYELEANMAQRRVRSCVIGLIPGDVIDAAVEQCEITLQQNADLSPEGLKKLSDAFSGFGVNKAMIEGRIQCKIEAIKPVQFATLRKIYVSLRDGMATNEDFFDVSLADNKKPEDKAPDLKEEAEKVKDKKEKKQPAEKKAVAPALAPDDTPPPPAKEKPLSDFERIRLEMVDAADATVLRSIWGNGESGANAAALSAMGPEEWNKLKSIYEGILDEMADG